MKEKNAIYKLIFPKTHIDLSGIARCFLLFLFFSMATLKISAQVSVSYYNSSLSKIGVAYNFNENVWSELRIYGNTFIDDVTPELVVCYNLLNHEDHRLYVGVGGSYNFFKAVVLPIGVQFNPIKNFINFSLHIELQPTFDVDTDLLFQSSWGLRYTFGEGG